MVEQVDQWGAPERYYAGQGIDASRGPVSASWEESLVRVAPGCEETVRRAVERWHRLVRQHLVTETGLQLRRRRVPIEIRPGLPPSLEKSLAGDEGIEEVMLNRPLLDAVVGGVGFMAEARDSVRNREGAIVGAAQPDELRNVRDTAKAWLAWADENDLSKRFGEIREDVFGAYMFNLRVVRIHWLPIGIYALMNDIPIDAMTVVVLAHELAHAYTHRGRDIDGFDWSTEQFAKTHIAVLEGLAQFYTQLVCRNLRASMPAAETAFDTLLRHQHPMYQVHKMWMAKAGAHSGEAVRTGMVDCRRANEPMDPLQFAEAVTAAAAI